jgi:hypothetical protein
VKSETDEASEIFHVVRTLYFGMKLYNDQCNAQVFNLFIYLLLPYMFRAFFSPSSEAGVQRRQWFMSSGYGVSARARIRYPEGFTSAEVEHVPQKMG